jgi:hypothetical protein
MAPMSERAEGAGPVGHRHTVTDGRGRRTAPRFRKATLLSRGDRKVALLTSGAVTERSEDER